MEVRKARLEEFYDIMNIYHYAQKRMIAMGNPDQWSDVYPNPLMVHEDIETERSYVLCEGDKLCGVFVFIIGDDPTYRRIEGGHWLNDEPYGVIHRIAAAEGCKGILENALAWAEQQIGNIRIDTHEANLIMQYLLEKLGYTICGTIYIDDGSPRIAYQKRTSVAVTRGEMKINDIGERLRMQFVDAGNRIGRAVIEADFKGLEINGEKEDDGDPPPEL